jgi:hypothetical protein
MNVFNRIVVIILVLILAVAAIGLALRPLEAVALGRGVLSSLEQGIFQDQFYLIFLASCIAVVVLALIILWLEIRSPRRKSVRVKTKGAGNAQLGVESVAQSLAYRVDEIAGVREVQPHIVSHGKDLEVALDIHTSPTVNIPMVSDQIVKLCHDIIEEQLGLKLHGKVRLNITHEPFPRGTMPSVGAPVAEAPASAARASESILHQPPATVARPPIVDKPAPEPRPSLFEEPILAAEDDDEEEQDAEA